MGYWYCLHLRTHNLSLIVLLSSFWDKITSKKNEVEKSGIFSLSYPTSASILKLPKFLKMSRTPFSPLYIHKSIFHLRLGQNAQWGTSFRTSHMYPVMRVMVQTNSWAFWGLLIVKWNVLEENSRSRRNRVTWLRSHKALFVYMYSYISPQATILIPAQKNKSLVHS